MVYDTARQLAGELAESPEYAAYAAARERAEESDATRALLGEYHRLQIRAQAAEVAGQRDEELLARMQKMGELLQFDQAASECLLAEYRLNRMLTDVYKLLAEAVGTDLGMLEG